MGPIVFVESKTIEVRFNCDHRGMDGIPMSKFTVVHRQAIQQLVKLSMYVLSSLYRRKTFHKKHQSNIIQSSFVKSFVKPGIGRPQQLL